MPPPKPPKPERPAMKRCVIALSLLGFLLNGSTACAGSAADDAFAAAVRPILAARCFGCHAGKAPEAGLDLERSAAGDQVLSAFRIWEKVVQKIATGAMPPEEARPLSNAQRRTL